jgi:hypothetical protein
MQISHAGKNEPRILKDGARPQPAAALTLARAASDAVLFSIKLHKPDTPFQTVNPFHGPIFGGCV